MIFKDAALADKELLMDMIQDFYSPPATLHGINRAHCEATFAETLRSHDYARIILMQQDGETVGYCMLSFTWSNESGGMVVWVEEIYIRPLCRGKGYGAQLLEWLQTEYAAATRFRLEVTAENSPAKRLYTKMGYTPLEYEQMIIDREL